MKLNQIAAIAAMLFAATTQADDSLAATKTALEQIVSCQKGASPEEVEALILAFGGKRIVYAGVSLESSNADYTFPNPIELWGRPIRNFTISDGWDGVSYYAFIEGESIQTIAKLAGITPNAADYYSKEVGNHDLTLAPESGSTYIRCEQNVRSLSRSISEAMDAVGQAFSN